MRGTKRIVSPFRSGGWFDHPWSVSLLSAGVSLLLIIAGQWLYAYSPFRKVSKETAATVRVDLQISRENDALVIHWPKAAASITHATHGMLTVTDGEEKKAMALTLEDLSTGVARYVPHSRNVSFSLAVFDAEPRMTGSVIFLDGNGPAKQLPAVGVVKPAPMATSAEAVRQEIAPPVLPADVPTSKAPPEPVLNTSTTTPSQTHPVPPKPIATAMEPARETTVVPPSANHATSAAYAIEVSTESPRTSRLEGVLTKVPFFRRSKKVSGELKPLRRTNPEIVRASLDAPLDVRIEIQVDGAGRVQNAQFVNLDLPQQSEFAWASLRAAKQWEFEPRSAGEAEKLVLHFHFEPPSRLAAAP